MRRAQIGGLQVFLVIKISAVHQMHMPSVNCRSEHVDETCVKHRRTRKDFRRIGSAFVFLRMVIKMLQIPYLSSMADEAIS